jgi:shikimate dehydrogenase
METMSLRPNYRAELVGVYGHPVSENPTVVMQEAGFQALNLNWRYLTIEVYPQDLGAAMQGLRALNMKGINLTIPHKVEVLKYLDEIKPDAALMGAVNTVIRVGDRLIGENTDGKGFMYALTHDAQVNPKGKKVLVLGAGGAARSITVELALAGAQRITIVNRSAERGKAVTELLNAKTPTKAHFIQWQGAYSIPGDTDILVNATSIGLFPNVHEKPDINYDSIGSRMVVCDVIHTPMTPFLKEAQDRGAKVVDGLGMLVYQGAIGFKLWTGLDAPVEAMHKALSKAFHSE